jgi:hypothetical protein
MPVRTKSPEANGRVHARPDAQPRPPAKEILAALRVLYRADQVVELRVPGYPRGGATSAGYFIDSGALVAYALDLCGKAAGVYVTLNEIDPALLARYADRVETWCKHTTTDKDVVRRRWLPLDFDPVRPSGISSTDAEHEAALERAGAVADWLAGQGWPEPVRGDSGNGAHLLYRIDLPNDEGAKGLVEGCLGALAARFTDGAVIVDPQTANAARIWKLYGTTACKGDPTEDRPHRTARLLRAPKAVEVVSVEQLEALAAQAPAPAGRAPGNSSGAGPGGARGRLDVPRWLSDRGVKFRPKQDRGTGWTCYLITCPFDPSHDRGEAAVMQGPNGALKFECKHATCADNGWDRCKEAIGAPDGNHYDPPLKGRGAPGWPDAGESYRPLDPYRPFPLGALPEPVRGYVRQSAACLGIDPAFVAAPLLSVLAAAIGNTRRVRLKQRWTEPAVIWSTTVAPSGTLKSPGLDAALCHVRLIQNEAIERWTEARREARTKADAGGEGEPPETSPCPRYVVSDTTVEALAVRLRENPRGLLLARDELNGWLASMDAYKSGRRGGGDVAHYLEMHRAGMLVIDRKSGPEPLVHVPRAALCVTGTTQPETFRRALGREHFENGLLPRFLVAMPPAGKRKWREDEMDPEVEAGFAAVVRRLYDLAFDWRKPGEPFVLDLDPEAKDLFVQFYDRHGEEQADLDGDLAAAWSKLEGYCARMALILEMVRFAADSVPRPPRPREGPPAARVAAALADRLGPQSVSAESVRGAVELVDWFGHEARRVYTLLTDEDGDRELHRLTQWVRARGGSATARELQQSGQKAYRGSAEVAEKALDRLAGAGVGEWETVRPGPAGGRPCRRLRLHATEPQKPS